MATAYHDPFGQPRTSSASALNRGSGGGDWMTFNPGGVQSSFVGGSSLSSSSSSVGTGMIDTSIDHNLQGKISSSSSIGSSSSKGHQRQPVASYAEDSINDLPLLQGEDMGDDGGNPFSTGNCIRS